MLEPLKDYGGNDGTRTGYVAAQQAWNAIKPAIDPAWDALPSERRAALAILADRYLDGHAEKEGDYAPPGFFAAIGYVAAGPRGLNAAIGDRVLVGNERVDIVSGDPIVDIDSRGSVEDSRHISGLHVHGGVPQQGTEVQALNSDGSERDSMYVTPTRLNTEGWSDDAKAAFLERTSRPDIPEDESRRLNAIEDGGPVPVDTVPSDRLAPLRSPGAIVKEQTPTIPAKSAAELRAFHEDPIRLLHGDGVTIEPDPPRENPLKGTITVEKDAGGTSATVNVNSTHQSERRVAQRREPDIPKLDSRADLAIERRFADRRVEFNRAPVGVKAELNNAASLHGDPKK